MKVLIIEPNKHYRAVLNSIMKGLGIDYVNSDKIYYAIEMLDSQEFDAITLSYYFENQTYHEMVKEIRRRKELKTAPIYLITSEDDPCVVNEAFKTGVTEVFFKDQISMISASLRRVKEAKDISFSGQVLYVEDQLSVAGYVTTILEGIGFDVAHFTTLHESKAYFDNHDVDLVVSDLLLEKGHSALSLISHIRNQETNRQRVPILAITAFDDPARRVDTFNIGANDFISKPFFPEELVARITQIMNSEQYLESVHNEKKRIEVLAITDQLSGLRNRYGFHSLVPSTLSLSRRYGCPLTVIFFDIDNFKSINDRFGHVAGDQIISFLGRTVSQSCREQDIATRWGGDEFVLLLYDTNTEQALRITQRLQQKISEYSEGNGFSCSIGMASLIAPDLDDLSKMLLDADKALFSAKVAGKNRCEVYVESITKVNIASMDGSSAFFNGSTH